MKNDAMDIKSQIESLLFISAKPVSPKELAAAAKIDPLEAEKICDELASEYKEKAGGILIAKNSGKYQMVSSPENASSVQSFLKDETTGELSRPSLEALTVIAYRGPITKSELERIRGVNCGLIIRNLMIRGLIDAKEDKAKKEIFYNVTIDFIRFLGINDVSELPDYNRLHKSGSLENVLGPEDAPDSQLSSEEQTTH